MRDCRESVWGLGGGGGRKLPGRHHLTSVQKRPTPAEWAIVVSLVWSLYLAAFLTNCSLAETFGLPVSKTESYSSLIWVNDIFTRLHRRRMVRHGSSIRARERRGRRGQGRELSFQTLPACLALSLSICNTPFYESPCQESLRRDNIISLYGHVFVFHTNRRGRFSRSKVIKKEKNIILIEKLLGHCNSAEKRKKEDEQ